MRATNNGLSPAASAGISVLLVATVALGVVYYVALQKEASTQLEHKSKSVSSPTKSKGKTNKLSPKRNGAAVAKNAKQKKKKPEPVAVRILYGTQTGTSKSKLMMRLMGALAFFSRDA